MNDMKLDETCPTCKTSLTLMESISTEQKLWIVKRCLQCGDYPVTEVVQLCVPKVVYCANCIKQLTH